MLKTVVEVVLHSAMDSFLSSERVVTIHGDVSRMRCRTVAKLGFNVSGPSTDSITLLTRVLSESLDEEVEESLRDNCAVSRGLSSSSFSSRDIIRNRNREVLVTSLCCI